MMIKSIKYLLYNKYLFFNVISYFVNALNPKIDIDHVTLTRQKNI